MTHYSFETFRFHKCRSYFQEAKTETPKEADVEAETKTDPKEKKETAKKAKVKLIDLPIEAQVFSLETNKMNKFHEQEVRNGFNLECQQPFMFFY